MQSGRAQAQDTIVSTPPAKTKDNLPELGRPSDSPGSFTPNPNGVTLDNRFDGKRLVVSPEYSNQTGLSLGGAFALPIGDNAAGGLLVTAGNQKQELLFNAGFQMSDAQRLVLTLGQQRQSLNIGFISGAEKTQMTQNSGAVSYQFRLEQGLLNSAEINGYLANTPSRDLADKTYARDTAALYELWNDPRRVAGGRVTGLQGRLVFAPLPGATFKLGGGGERLENDYLTGKQSSTRATGSAEWTQCLSGGYQIKAGADAAVQNRYTLGLERPFGDSGQFGASFTGIRGRNGAPDDNQLKLTWSYALDSKRSAPTSCGSAAQAWGSLLDEVAKRPSFLPAQVVARLDTTTVPLRLIAVNKAALPAGSSINTVTGVVTTPLGVAVTGIAGVTLNAAPFANTGQFGIVGNNLVIDPNKITQPAVGVTDTYVVTVNNFGGGTTLVTLVMSRGSVKIDSITIGNGVATDVTAPTTSAAPSVSGTTDTATTLSVTINESGTGYYLVQAAAAAAPSVAAVQAGTAFVMTANVAATPAISGLTAATAYKIYFVAKDAANNVQAAVQSVAMTTSATPDVTAPTTSAGPSVSGTTDIATTLSSTINETGTGYYLVQAAAAAAPSVAAVQAGTAFAMTANVAATPAISGLMAATAYKIYFVAKDAANNVQAAVQSVNVTTSATPDVTAPTTSAGPSVSGTTDTATTLSATINENGTGYYLVQAAAAAAPSVAAVQAGTAFVMTANVAATPAISGLTASTAYKIYFVAKDAANNVQAAVQNVAVTTNALPTANNFTYGTNIDNAAKTFSWLALSAAADADGDPLTATVQAQGAKGTFVVAGNNVTYTPSANQTVSDSGTLRISDGRGGVKDIVVTVNGIDTAPPAAPTGLALDGGAASTTAASVALNNFTDPLDADLAAWFVSESGSAPVAGDAGWSSTKPTTYTFATATNETKTVCVYVKDTLGNVQPTGACDTIAKVAAATAPTASSVAISGTVQAGQLLTGSYTYADVNGDPQGTSTFRWLRGGVAIAGATASTYTLVIADVGSAITFEVTPVATVAPTTRTPVVSGATAAVTLPAGYVAQGGLTWMPATFTNNWAGADTYCSGTSILGQTGWRLPTQVELSALYASGAMNGQGWSLIGTWSSTSNGVGTHEVVYLDSGNVSGNFDTDSFYVTCVR